MSGHSKWSTIKRKKGAADAKRGKIFSKLIKQITSSARKGGGDSDANAELRFLIDKAKQANMPAENVKRAIAKGTGDLEGADFTEMLYEGYGPGGVALLIEVLTDNINRAASEIRYIFSKSGGSLGAPGCVAWLFDKRGQILVDAGTISEDDLLGVALEAGVDDIVQEGDFFEVTCEPSDFLDVKQAFDDAGVTYESAEVVMIPQTTVKVEGSQAKQVLRLVEKLEDNDDVENVYANFDIDDEVMEEMET
ncbi:MAG: YebC/PmpR family DNA-binding transcriptional regulator [bacterium]|nr:YebC/PmpR family DNA-binding transcriptional regulator [bacterium]